MSAEVWRMLRDDFPERFNGIVEDDVSTGDVPVLRVSTEARTGTAKRLIWFRPQALLALPFVQLITTTMRRVFSGETMAVAAAAAAIGATGGAELVLPPDPLTVERIHIRHTLMLDRVVPPEPVGLLAPPVPPAPAASSSWTPTSLVSDASSSPRPTRGATQPGQAGTLPSPRPGVTAEPTAIRHTPTTKPTRPAVTSAPATSPTTSIERTHGKKPESPPGKSHGNGPKKDTTPSAEATTPSPAATDPPGASNAGGHQPHPDNPGKANGHSQGDGTPS